MDASAWVLVAFTLALAIAAVARDRSLPLAALKASGRAASSVWLELLLGFVLLGLIEVLVSKEALASWLAQRGDSAIFAGWIAGLVLPGGPYAFFPLLAGLAEKGAPTGALIALASAKLLVSPVRMLSYEAPLMGWPFALARLLPGLLVPPLLGFAGQWLYQLFTSSPSR